MRILAGGSELPLPAGPDPEGPDTSAMPIAADCVDTMARAMVLQGKRACRADHAAMSRCK